MSEWEEADWGLVSGGPTFAGSECLSGQLDLDAVGVNKRVRPPEKKGFGAETANARPRG